MRIAISASAPAHEFRFAGRHGNIGKIIVAAAGDDHQQEGFFIADVLELPVHTGRNGDHVVRREINLLAAIAAPANAERAGQAHEALDRIMMGVQQRFVAGRAARDDHTNARLPGNGWLLRHRATL